jgi:hypothetical protein
MTYCTKKVWTISLSLCLIAISINAENIVFPNIPGVIDITKTPYNADKTGKTDCAAIFDLALTNERSQGYWGPRILYVPNGTYLVKHGISWKLPPGTIGPHLVGQSRKGAVIRLADSTFRSSTQANFVVQTGGDVAQNFCRGLSNVTINTGKGNPGAIGVFWYSNNEGLMSDVDIVSEDGLGVAGLRIGTVEEGPAMVRRVYIKGFGYGVWSSADLNSVTLSQIAVEGQRLCGVLHQSQSPIFIDSLTSINRVVAVANQSRAELTLINASLTGGNPDTVAIINKDNATIFARNIVTQGYKAAIASNSHTVAPPTGPNIEEYSSHGYISQFNSPLHSLNLPIKRPPEPEWEQDLTKWADITKYATGRTDAAAFQAAIDDPTKTVVVFPSGRDYTITGDVIVRGKIQWIMAAGAQLTGTGTISVADAAGAPSVVKFMKIMGPQGAVNISPSIVQKSNRTLILESVGVNGASGIGFVDQGSGDVFATDVINVISVTNPQAHVWAWHYNAEGGTNRPKLDVKAGTMWIFGWKDEGWCSSANLTGGVTEIIGYMQYGFDSTFAQFEVTNASFSVAMGLKCYYGRGYTTLVRETRGGVTKNYLASANTQAGFPTQYDLPVYCGYDATAIRPAKSAPKKSGDPKILSAVCAKGILHVRWIGGEETPDYLSLANSSGQIVWHRTCQAATEGVVAKLPSLPCGLYQLIARSETREVSQCAIILQK